MASVGPVDARTESVPSTNPRTYAPESPIYRDAGGKLNGRKPSPAPTIATSSSATVGCEDAAAIDAIVAVHPVDGVSDRHKPDDRDDETTVSQVQRLPPRQTDVVHAVAGPVRG